MALGRYNGQWEESPGKMIYRHKGVFASKDNARAFQKKLAADGQKAKVVTFTDGYSVYVMAPHEFWKSQFIVDKEK